MWVRKGKGDFFGGGRELALGVEKNLDWDLWCNWYSFVFHFCLYVCFCGYFVLFCLSVCLCLFVCFSLLSVKVDQNDTTQAKISFLAKVSCYCLFSSFDMKCVDDFWIWNLNESCLCMKLFFALMNCFKGDMQQLRQCRPSDQLPLEMARFWHAKFKIIDQDGPC